MKDMLTAVFTKLQENVEYDYYILWMRTGMSFVLKERA